MSHAPPTEDLGRRTLLSRTAGLLGSAGVLGVGGLAGCLGGGGRDGADSPARDDATTGAATATGTPASDSLASHPAAAGLSAQPTLGDQRADAVIVAFEDPSCPRCRAFERQTVPRLRSELVEPGDAAFVLRTYPVVYPWGEPAVYALEATYAREAAAHWDLFEHYLAEQDAFDTENVLDRTRQWLESNTALDAAAVVDDAASKAYDDAVQADLTAGENAGVGRTTPTVFLFKDGRYRTRASGSVSFELIASALEG